MRILFLIDTLASGGKERRLIELLKQIKALPEIEFELAVMNKDIHFKEVLKIVPTIHYIIRKRKKDFSIFHKMYNLLKNYNPDIVHCWDSMSAVFVAPACKMLCIKLVNGMVIDSPIKQNIFNKHWLRAKLTFPFSSLIIGNSNAGLKAYNAPSKKSIVIHNGFNFERTKSIVPIEFLQEQIKIQTKYVVCMVASFSKNKDYKTYFHAAQLLLMRRKDITFLAIGDQTDSALSENLIENNVKDYFRLLGKQVDVESFINISDICVLSTFTEGISNAILEYMALSKPVIATSGGGTNEIIVDKVTGFIINKCNPQELADKMELLLQDKIMRMTMGTAGKERIDKKFTIEKMVKDYVNAYKSVSLL